MSDQTGEVPISDIKLDENGLFREEVFTDLRMGTIRRLVPVKTDGSVDESRAAMFTGEAQILTQAGPIPVSAPIEANNLQEAIAAFPAAVERGVERLRQEVAEMQRREASRIVVPGKDTPPPKIELP